jgi:hypothetical protein
MGIQMSVVEYTTMGGGLLNLDKRMIRRYFFLTKGNVGKKRLLFRRSELITLPTLSIVPQAADAWNLLTSGQKSAWGDAANESGLSAYNQFIQDKVYRIINEIAGNAVPSEFHQYLVGHLNIPTSAGHFLLRQCATDSVDLPAALHLHYKSALTDEDPGNGYLKCLFSYTYDEGGGLLTQTNEINLLLNTDWTSQNVSITNHTGLTGYWKLEFEGDKVHGDLWFDDLYCLGAYGVITKDANCERSDLVFKGLVLPAGMTCQSVYPAD